MVCILIVGLIGSRCGYQAIFWAASRKSSSMAISQRRINRKRKRTTLTLSASCSIKIDLRKKYRWRGRRRMTEAANSRQVNKLGERMEVNEGLFVLAIRNPMFIHIDVEGASNNSVQLRPCCSTQTTIARRPKQPSRDGVERRCTAKTH